MYEISKVWPKWDVVSVLGQGGFGKVYKVKRETFGEVTYGAVKVVKIPSDIHDLDEMASTGLSAEGIRDYYRGMVGTLLDEIKMMERMKSASHIVAIEDYEVVENTESFGWTIYIRMELLQNLSEYTKQHVMSEDEVKRMGLDILKALEFCHNSNIVHRDIKPGNILVSQFGEYKVGDFGISREVEKANATMSQKGTKSYMAPEMIRLGKYGKNVDIYALGLTMYELLNHGRMPFLPPYPENFYPNDRELAMFRRLNGDPIPDAVNASPAMNRILKKACAANPQERYQRVEDMRDDLLNMNKGEQEFANGKHAVPFVKTKQEDQAAENVNWEGSEYRSSKIMGENVRKENDFGEPSEYRYSRVNQQKTPLSGGWLFEDSQTDPVHGKNQKKQDLPSDRANSFDEGLWNDSKKTELLPLQRRCPDCGKTEYLQFTHGYLCASCGKVHIYKQDSNTIKVRDMFVQYVNHPLQGKEGFFAIMQMLAIDETSAQLASRAANILSKEGGLDAAIQWFEDALKFDDRDANIYTSLGAAYHKKKDYKMALTYQEKAYHQLERGMISWENSKIVYANYCAALVENNLRDDAVKIYHKAKNAGHNNLSSLEKRLGLAATSTEKLEKFMASSPYIKDAPKWFIDEARKKEQKIRTHFRTIPSTSKIYLFYDLTVFGSAKQGVVISEAGIHRIGQLANEKVEKMIPWNELYKYDVERRTTSQINLLCKSEPSGVENVYLNIPAHFAANIIFRVIKYLKES